MFQLFDPNSLSRKAKLNARANAGLVEIKSKFNAEYRRFSVDVTKPPSLQEMHALLQQIHQLNNTPIFIAYTDKEGDLLPINNPENFTYALKVSRPVLRISLFLSDSFQKQGFGGALPKKSMISRMLEPETPTIRTNKPIGQPENFRYVSAIIDADVLPPTQRRVKLIGNNNQKQLGFFVRDGYSMHPTSSGSLKRVPGVFISRLVPGGLAESTGLLAANDEVLEVNGIEVAGKSLDQVTDMMVANSSHLIITIKPCNQYTQVTLPSPNTKSFARSSYDDLSRSKLPGLSESRAKTLDSRITSSLHDLKAAANVNGVEEKEGNNLEKTFEEEDDIREFVRRDPSGSSASNRNSTQLMQQQQQLEHLKRLNLQKEQLEEQLKQQQHQQKQYELRKQLEQQKLLKQFELQEHINQQDSLLQSTQHTTSDNTPAEQRNSTSSNHLKSNSQNLYFDASNHFSDIQPPYEFKNNLTNNDNNLLKFSRNVLIKDLQSLDQLDKNFYDEENIRFVEGGGYEESEIFGNSSLRINPHSNVRSRLSTRSVDHNMKKKKNRF